MTGFAARFLLCLIVLLLPFSTEAATPKKVAMVVGNSAYQSVNPLPNTLNDAKAIASSLERLGFKVFGAYDETKENLLRTFGQFSEDLKDADAAVFYYAGHGMQIDGENYILPVDIKLESPSTFRYGALSLSDVLGDVETRSRVAIVILDACRDNPFADALAAADPGRSASRSRGLAPMRPSGNGAIIAYAAAAGQVASDGAGAHSPYTKALLDEMEKPGVEVGLLFRRVAGQVIDETGGVQRPEILVRLASEYYLSDLPAVPVVTAAALPQTPQPAPVDVAQAEAGTRKGPSLFGVTIAPEAEAPPAVEPRQAEEPRGTRAALWDYNAAVIDGPFDEPTAAWTPPESKTLDETEPNNSFGTALPLDANDVVNMSISPAGDRDYVRFAVQQGGHLTVHAPETPTEVNLSVRMLDANGYEIVSWTSAPRAGGELLAEFDLGRPGTYWLDFADAASGASTTSFPVTLSFSAEPDLYENNDRVDLAKHIALDSEFPINILPRGDRDYFKFVVPQPGSLIVSLTDAPETISGAFRLLDANGYEIISWNAAPRPGGDAVGVLDLPRPGTYYLDVADNTGSGSDVRPLKFSTRFAPSPDTFEPNDTMANAYPVEPTSTSTLAIFPARDTDWLELNIDQPGELTVEAKSPPANLNLTYRIVNGDGYEVGSWNPAPRPGGDLYGSFDFGKPGRYYLQLADNNNAASVEPVTLDLKFAASLDAYEPNDTIGTARPITAGGEVQFTMLPLGDADWFRVSVDQPGELAVTIDEQAENLDIAYRVVNTDWNELASWTNAYRKGGLTEGSVDLPRAGTYYLEVRDGNNDGRSIQPATLKTVFTPTVGSNEPNNTFGEATPVEITGETEAHILPIGDADFHVFYADSAGELDVEVDNAPENVDVAFRLLNAEQSEIQSWINAPRPGGVTTGTVTIPAAGWYWMEIRDGNNDARSPQPFTVKRTFRPTE